MPENAIKGGTEQLLQMGLPGILILILLWVSWQLFKRYEAALKADAEKSEQRNEKMLVAVNSNTAALEGLTQLLQDRRQG